MADDAGGQRARTKDAASGVDPGGHRGCRVLAGSTLSCVSMLSTDAALLRTSDDREKRCVWRSCFGGMHLHAHLPTSRTSMALVTASSQLCTGV